jgi:heptosyltransferase-2
VAFVAAFLLDFFNLVIIYRFGEAIGDTLGITSIIEAWKTNKKFIIFANNEAFFLNNPKVYKVISTSHLNASVNRLIRIILTLIQSKNILRFEFNSNQTKKLRITLQEYLTKNNCSLFEAHSLDFKNFIITNKLQTKIYISNIEKEETLKKFKLKKNFYNIIFNSPKEKPFSQIKKWSDEELASVVESKFRNYKWILLGSQKNKDIYSNLLNLEGKTTLRELIILISECNLVLTIEGLIAHIASSFGKKTIILQTGLTNSRIVKIHKNKKQIIINEKDIPCSPCWKKKCDQAVKICQTRISKERIEKEIARLI